jgi:hypothetical protein
MIIDKWSDFGAGQHRLMTAETWPLHLAARVQTLQCGFIEKLPRPGFWWLMEYWREEELVKTPRPHFVQVT